MTKSKEETKTLDDKEYDLVRKQFRAFWKREWNKLEGDIDEFSFKFYKEGYKTGKQEGKKEWDEKVINYKETIDILHRYIDELKVELAKEIKWREFNIQHQKEFNKSAKREAKKEFLEIIDKLAKKEKAVEVDIWEYDKFISVHNLKAELEK